MQVRKQGEVSVGPQATSGRHRSVASEDGRRRGTSLDGLVRVFIRSEIADELRSNSGLSERNVESQPPRRREERGRAADKLTAGKAALPASSIARWIENGIRAPGRSL